MYVCICIYIHTCMHVQAIYIYLNIYVYMNVFTCMYIYMYIFIYIYIDVFIYYMFQLVCPLGSRRTLGGRREARVVICVVIGSFRDEPTVWPFSNIRPVEPKCFCYGIAAQWQAWIASVLDSQSRCRATSYPWPSSRGITSFFPIVGLFSLLLIQMCRCMASHSLA